ncbi:hypothetical protein F4823DRAFT_581914 [Ustulina deusta]|nr:hypothetical protein F4823DRAFT_581914 [Ustulina deusta]
MADVKPTPSGNAPGARPWLRWAQIVNQGTDASFTPFLGDDEELRDYLADYEGADKEIHVFDLIQQARLAYFNPPTLQILLNSLVDALPQAIQERVGLHLGADYPDPDTGPVIGQPSWFSQDDARFQKTLDSFKAGTLPPLDSENKEFVLWVVDTGTPKASYYVTIVLWYRPSDPSKPNVFDRIANWAVIDARHVEQKSAAAERTADRVLQLLQGHFEGAVLHDVWLPPYQQGKGEDYASGLIAYSVVTQLLDRIGTMHCTKFDTGALFAPFRPWFNPEAIRAEALGRAAMKAMEKLDWKARLGMFPIQPPGNDQPLARHAQELASGEALPIAYPRLPSTKGDKATSTLDSLFGDYVSQDSATQTAEQPPSPINMGTQTEAQENPNTANEGPPSAEVRPRPDRTLIFSLSSSSSSSSSPGLEVEGGELLELYYQRKLEDLNRAILEAEGAREVCQEAQEFAERLEYEVLEAPTNNIPTPYAMQRLLWLVRRAVERARYIEQLRDSLDRTYTINSIHAVVAERLQFSRVRLEFGDRLAEYKRAFSYADRILNRAYVACIGLGPIDELGESALGRGIEDDEGGDDDGIQDGNDDGSEGIPELIPSKRRREPRSTIPKKRKYTKAPTSALDEDGQEVFTLELNTETRPLRKKKPAKKAKK